MCDYRGLQGLEKKHAVMTFQPNPRPVQLNGLSLGELHLSVKMKTEERKTKDIRWKGKKKKKHTIES